MTLITIEKMNALSVIGPRLACSSGNQKSSSEAMNLLSTARHLVHSSRFPEKKKKPGVFHPFRLRFATLTENKTNKTYLDYEV